MATSEQTVTREQPDIESNLRTGSLLMALAGIGFIGYGLVFLVMNFVGGGFEIGVSTLAGMTPAEMDPTVAYYISHLHVATAAFIISTGIAVTALSWYGVRQRLLWAWATAIVASVVGLALALPMHWTGVVFAHNWIVHLGPIYFATVIFVVGAVLSYQTLKSS